MRSPEQQEPEVRVLCLIKGEHRYMFLFRDTPEDKYLMFNKISEYAYDPAHYQFTWSDVASLLERMQDHVEDYDGEAWSG